MDTDTDTGDRHILQIKFAQSYVITYYKKAKQQKAMQIDNIKLPIPKCQFQIANFTLQIENC